MKTESLFSLVYSHFLDDTKDDLKATWIGHATVLAEIDGAIVLTDPIFSQRCFPVQWAGPKRYRPPACTIEELPDVVGKSKFWGHLTTQGILKKLPYSRQ